MAESLLLFLTLFACIYGYSYARWLSKNGNKTGAISMFVLIVATIFIPVAMWYLGL